MSLNQTPMSERVHIGIFGKRNAGKSSIMNAITNQQIAIVSEVQGTTTDPVCKSMEMLPLGPVMLIDTPGLDDEGTLGALRIQKALEVLRKTDVALVVVDGTVGAGPEETALEQELKKRKIPYLIIYNKCDLCKRSDPKVIKKEAIDTEDWEKKEESLWVSTVTGEGIEALKKRIAHLIPDTAREKKLVADLLCPMDFVVLVVPIDKAAPKGRLILPQQQTIRDILEAGAVSIVVQDTELKETLEKLSHKPRLVITDSQVFEKAAAVTPEDIWLTSFSILFARYKGNLQQVIEGVKRLDELRDGDRVLISEGCTHHRQCGDIGTEKLPRWITTYMGKSLEFVFTSGTEFPKDLKEYGLVVHCGGCMLNEKEMQYRLAEAKAQNVPMTNYGILIAYIKGILKRSVQPFPSVAALLEKEE